MLTASRTFRAIAEAVVPEVVQLDDSGWRSMCALVERAVAQRPAKMQRQLALFVRILNLLSLLKHRKKLHSLPSAVRTRFLENIQNSNLLLFRRGFWGLRTLVLMGYYARPEAMSQVGYCAHARGWEMRA